MTPRILSLLALWGVAGCGVNNGDSPTDGGSPGDGGLVLEPYQADLLAGHNATRAAAMPAPSPALAPMTWSPTVAAAAQDWANRCKFEHSSSGTSGQNLYASTANDNAAAAIDSWTDEVADYNYATNMCASGKICGHYTQVVWRTSTQLGCGKKECTVNSPFPRSSTWYFWVCDYAPPGNFLGQKPY